MSVRECYCHDGPGAGCSPNKTCWSSMGAACYHSMKEVYDELERRMTSIHTYGCLPYEADGSKLQCKGALSPHHTPHTIACCFHGHLCNKDLHLQYNFVGTTTATDSGDLQSTLPLLLYVVIAAFFALVAFAIFGAALYWRNKLRRKKRYLKDNLEGANKSKEALLGEKMKWVEEMSSGSGGYNPEEEASKGFTHVHMTKRTIVKDLDWRNKVVVGSGRYGTVYKCMHRGDTVAVKEFHSLHESSWIRECDIYKIPLNHANVLRFIASDIGMKPSESETKMLIISEFHALGSLHDYLKRQPLTPSMALKLSLSAASGLAYLHNSRCKSGIAHRDIKSKNIMVKRDEECCIGDFGLAIKRNDDNSVTPDMESDNSSRVGTKRYMAPELLDESFDCKNFDAYVKVDMYAFALVLWEISRRTMDCEVLSGYSLSAVTSTSDCGSSIPSYINSSGPTTIMNSVLGSETSSGQHSWTSGPSMSSNVSPYECPYHNIVPPDSDPTFDQMKKIVCDERKRPPIDQRWEKEGSALYKLANLMKECWAAHPDSRLSAIKVKMELQKVMDKMGEGPFAHTPISTPIPQQTIVPQTVTW